MTATFLYDHWVFVMITDFPAIYSIEEASFGTIFAKGDDVNVQKFLAFIFAHGQYWSIFGI